MNMSYSYGFFQIFAFIIPILYLFLLGFFIFFAIKVLQFMGEKNRADQELNNKLDRILSSLEKREG